ncbi:MAG: nuclear transport factor 2 family protein [Algoriphagus sp.]|nr:nuclear transport factor 2 family protein [Algoriphagus sp.]
MNPTKQQEEEARIAHDLYWESYLKGDVETLASLLDNDYTQIGSVEEEVFFTKKDAVQFVLTTIDQIAGNVQMRNRVTKSGPVDDFILFSEQCDLYVLSEGEWTFYSKFRASSLMKLKDGSWKLVHQHSSLPDSKAQEGENIAIEKISAENLQLRDAVKRRTIELENKSKELEIEALLERVRAVAMGMKKPDDILTICKVMFTELQLLGFSKLRNMLINFWDDDSSSLIDYDYSDETGGNKATLSYNSHPIFEQFQKTIKNSKDAFAELVVTKEQLESWKQRRRDNGEYEDPRLNTIDSLYYYFYSIEVGAIGISTFSPITTGQLSVLKRFRNVFDFAYRRYVDVAQAEAQAREAKIEAALERVRARTMAMQHSDELKDAAALLFQQVKALGVPVFSCGYNIWEKGEKEFTAWMTNNDGTGINPAFSLPLKGDANFIRFHESRQQGEEFYVLEMGGDRMQEHYRYLIQNVPVFKETFENILKAGQSLPETQIHHIVNFSHGNLMFITYEPCPEAHDIFIRFAKVFEQTYTRFLDLQRAEAQAREAQIETVLERVRSRTLGMQKSGELREVIQVIFEQFQNLGIDLYGAAFAMDYMESEDWFIWSADIANLSPTLLHIPYFDHPYWNSWNDARRKGLDSLTYTMELVEKNNFVSEFVKYIPDLPAEVFQSVLSTPGYTVSNVFLKNITLYIDRFNTEPFSDADNAILMRFGKVFEQTYTRFKDLEKAEAQAREAQIEVAVERVRAKALAMHRSEEILGVAVSVRDAMVALDLQGVSAATIYLEQDNGCVRVWDITELLESEKGPYLNLDFEFRLEETDSDLWFHRIWNFKEKYCVVEMDKDDLWKCEAWLRSFDLKNADNFLRFLESGQITHLWLPTVFLERGKMNIDFVQPPPAEMEFILTKMAAAFDLAYKRFLDLQKAEAQAREAKIEATLERVRARTMAMQRSEELPEVAALLFQQVKTLGVPQFHCGFNIFEIDDKECTWYPGSADGDILPPCKIPLTEHPIFMAFNESRKRGDELFVYEKEGEYQAGHYRYMLSLPVLGEMLQNMLDAGIPFPTFQIDHLANFSHGNLLFITSEHFPEMHDTFKRLAKVFEQTYTRFLDLQKAEAQAREAEISLALERVRARTLAMQRSEELIETSLELWKQVDHLGIPAFGCGFNIWDADKKFATAWMGGNERTQPPFKTDSSRDIFKRIYEAERKGDSLFVEIQEGEAVKEHYSYLTSIPVFKNIEEEMSKAGLSFPDFQIMHCSFFAQGYLMFITFEPVPWASDIFKRFSKVFEQTYTPSLISKKPRRRQEKPKLKMHWRKSDHEPWRCSAAMN